MSLFNSRLLAVALFVAPAWASAAINVSIGSDTRAASDGVQSFALDVTFTNDGASQPLVGHDSALQISGGAGLSITGVGIGSNQPANPVLTGDPAFSTNGSLYLISQVQQSPGSIDNGDGLFRILLQAAPGTIGSFEISFFQSDSSGFDTKLYSDANSNEVPNTTFNVGTVTLVPEPAALGVILMGLPLLGRRRRRDFAR